MKIGELAQRANVNVQTIRYYERRKLLSDPRGGQTGYREYDEGDLARLQFIREAQALGFTLREVTELLRLRTNPGASATDVKARARDKLEQVRAKIQGLRRLERQLVNLLAGCAGAGPTSACGILGRLDQGGRARALADAEARSETKAPRIGRGVRGRRRVP